MAELDGIDERHHKPTHPIWVRWALVTCIAALPVLALANVFGQHAATSTASAPAADVRLTAPSRLRGGLVFQVKVTIAAHRPLKELALSFASGWWDSMTVNTITPAPSAESSKDGHVVLEFGELPAGHKDEIWMELQVNPNNVGNRDADVTVLDGEQPLAHIHRSLTIFP
jgi:hypothetical protein